MTAETNEHKPGKRRKWLRFLIWSASAIVVLVVALYFLIGSTSFLKSVVLPRVGKSMGADISATDVKFSPFSQLALSNVKVVPKGGEPLFSAGTVRVRYKLLSIISGSIAVDEITLTSPTITLIENADGSSNLDPLTRGEKPQPKPSSKPTSSKPPSVNIKAVSIENATFRHVKNLDDGRREVFQATNFNFKAENIGNGQSGKLDASTGIAMSRSMPTNSGQSTLEAQLTLAFNFELAPNLKPATVKGDGSFTVQKATGEMRELNALVAKLNCDVAAAEVKEIAVRFSRGATALGRLNASGPFNSSKTEGKIKVEVVSLDRNVLNLAGVASGLDFGTTLINSTNELEFAAGGDSITAAGILDIAHLQIIKQKETSPTLDIACDYSVGIDGTGQTALLKTLNLTGTQNQRLLLRGGLTSPMKVALGEAKVSAGDSAFHLVLTNLDLADWKALASGAAPRGLVNANVRVRSQGGGELAVDLDTRLNGFSMATGAEPPGRLDAQVQAHVLRKQDGTLSGQTTLADVNGSYGNYQFADYGCVVDFDLATHGDEMQIRKVAGRLQEGRNSGGTFEFSGRFNPVRNEGTFDLSVADVNERGLRPFLEPALTGKKLVSVSANSTASATLGRENTDVKVDFRLANLVVNGATETAPVTPLKLRLQVDATASKQTAEARQCQLTLTPTERAKNELNLTGKVDFSNRSAITGNLKLLAESLDLTSYYDLISSRSKPVSSAPPSARTPPGSPPADANKEPDAKKLPFKDFVAEIDIGRIYLREVDVERLQATARLDGGHLVLKPCQLSLNGAPITAAADCDLGVPGYKYDATFDAQKVPLAPLMNSFKPDRKGHVAGTLTAMTHIKGEGTTGASLQKSLTGRFDIASTNMNLSIHHVRSPILNTLLNVVIGIPDLLREPTSKIANFAGRLLGVTEKKGGWADEITAAPIDVIAVRGNADNGQIKLEQAEVHSTAFKAEATGDIAIAPILTNSTINIPVTVSLSRSLAEKAGLLAGDTPTNAVYSALPHFFTEEGTLGQPKPALKPLVLAGIAAKASGGVATQIPISGVKGVGSSLNALGGLLGFGKQKETNAPAISTNAPPAGTNQTE